MLTTILALQHSHFESIAESWLLSGAEAFIVMANGAPLASWPSSASDESPTLISSIWVGHSKIGELCVIGPTKEADKSRLQVEAAMIASLVQSTSILRDVTTKLIDTQDQLVAIYDLTQAMRKEVELDDVLRLLVFETARLVNLESAFIIIQWPNEPWIIHQYPDLTLDLTTLESMLGMVQKTDQYFLLSEEDEGSQDLSFRNLLLFPIALHDHNQATLGLVNKLDGDFLFPDIKLAQAIADNVGARIENALLHNNRLEQAKMQMEMEMAKRVQLNLLPKQTPIVPGIDFWASSRPASQVGGDFYDFLYLDKRPFIFTVGDISGKGMPAAILMAMTRTVIRANIHDIHLQTPEYVVRRSNEHLYDDFTEVSMFATMFIGQYQPQTQEMLYANAGHSPVIYCPYNGRARLLEADGTAIGILPTSFSENQKIIFKPGDVLIVATDGLSEAYNKQEEMFGYDRLLTLTEKLATKSAQEIATELYRTVHEFSTGTPQFDDQTVMVLKGAAI